MPSHTKKEVFKSYDRKLAARKRREERQLAKEQAAEAIKASWQWTLVWIKLSYFGFYLAAFVAIISMVTFVFYWKGWLF